MAWFVVYNLRYPGYKLKLYHEKIHNKDHCVADAGITDRLS
jgi:hypothetical protein